jgi:hypothetical protein
VPEANTWKDLPPDEAMLTALDFADGELTRAEIRKELDRIGALPSEAQQKRERPALREMRKRWSERFATACATMLASELRAHASLDRRYSVLPAADGTGQESFVPLGYTRGKRIDVVVTGPLVGLQLGVSLKGLNFADDQSGNHDKNLTGRLYELRDEVSTVHDYLPRAFMGAFFFVPVSACVDKTGAPSSFAHVVAELRSRTGRLDPSVTAHSWRCDFAAVGLYAAGDPWEATAGVTRGAVRYFPLQLRSGDPNLPPRRGLPQVPSTLDLGSVVGLLLARSLDGSAASAEYAAPEAGSDGLPQVAADEADPGSERP